MKIEFVGGAKSVTGSSYIIKDDDFTIMIDCGMFQGSKELKERNALDLIYNPGKIDSLILTHAHIDHSGLIPKLVKNGFYGNIYATQATADLCTIMLPDSAHIQEMDTKWINKKRKKLDLEPTEPLYTADDAVKSLSNFVPVNYGDTIQINPRVHIRFRDAGHILGSSFVEMWIDEGDKKTKIVFSGDIGQKESAIIRDPDIVEDADILLLESTYGDRLHKSKEDTETEFISIINETHKGPGNIVIPSFAIERTQEIIYLLSKLFRSGKIPVIPVYIDSPLAISATEIFKKNSDCFDDEIKQIFSSGESPLDFPSLRFVRTTADSKKLNDEASGAIIISASGMCNAGRIKYHLMNNLYRPESSVVFVGYQADGTLGRRLVEGARQVRIYGEDVIVRAKIHTLGGFSAHADKNGLLEWAGKINNPKLRVFVIHGEGEASTSLADELRTRYGFTTHVPDWGEIVDLETMKTEVASYAVADTFTSLDRDIESLAEIISTINEKYKRAKNENKIKKIKHLQEDINDAKQMLAMIIDEL